MRIKLALVTILASLTIDVAGAPTSGQYVDDQQRFFVEGSRSLTPSNLPTPSFAIWRR